MKIFDIVSLFHENFYALCVTVSYQQALFLLDLKIIFEKKNFYFKKTK